MDSYNSFAQADVVKPVAFHGVKLRGDTLTISLPAKSVVAIEIGE